MPPDEPKIRPSQIAGASTQEIRERVAEIREIDDTWRIWVKEWILDSHHLSQESALSYGAEKYDGRLVLDDMKVEPNGYIGGVDLLTCRWNIRSEWKTRALAEANVPVGTLFEITGRNSMREHELRDYGHKKLPKART